MPVAVIPLRNVEVAVEEETLMIPEKVEEALSESMKNIGVPFDAVLIE